MANDRSESLLTYAGLGGAAVCCLVIELLGGAVILGGLAAIIGLSTGLTYLVVAGIGGLTAAFFVLGYRQLGGTSHV
jgi:hypothetical protein